MQIVPFLPHYQLVYANFDFASFSVISYTAKQPLLQCRSADVTFKENYLYKTKGKITRNLDKITKKEKRPLKEKSAKTSKRTFALFIVGMTGLEPATTGPPDQHSKPTELHPAWN